MKKIINFSIPLFIVLSIFWLVVQHWFGINIPLLKTSTTQTTLNQRLKIPETLTLSVFADQLSGARSLLVTEMGDLLVSLPKRGSIILLKRDTNNDGISDSRKELISGLKLPHGMDFYQDWLYIAETDAIGRIRFNTAAGKTVGEYERIITQLPSGGNHWSRTIHFGPDGMLYVSIGSSCNVCEEKDPRRAAILRFTPAGQQAEIFATGLRNTVGFDWHPLTQTLYGIDNGRDFLGDDFPPCELNQIEQGGFYGWPYLNGSQIPDPDFGNDRKNRLLHSIAPAYEFGAHTAPLSIKFIENKNLRALIQSDALVTQHGSWNRSVKTGYKIIALQFDPKAGISARDFITGFELNDNVIGRPVDIAESSDGKLYISDDFSGKVYQIQAKPK